MDLALENELRAVAFAWLNEQMARHGDVLEGRLLRRGFDFMGQSVPLAVQQGIHKPKFVEAALSLRTSFDSPYSDYFDGEETLVYRYRGKDPNSWDNRAARCAFEHQLPLIYMHAVSENPPKYVVVRPVFIVADDPASLAFRLQAELPAMAGLSARLGGASALVDAPNYRELQRSYGTRLVRSRLHQETFRQRVIQAYQSQCAMCRLRHVKLLDAAHIDRDADPFGEPVISNGLSLCRIHHAAFDVRYLSVEPDTYRVRVQPVLLDEEDGPILEHGLQAMEGVRLQLPKRKSDYPDPERLRRHWEGFLAAS
ncbi:MAG TPA: HNH endonuclease [Planctomycetota bacterium]|nr:HNH endonuclease [Planctomycetota bacterium]